MLMIQFDEDKLLNKENDFELSGASEKEFRAVLAEAGWKPRQKLDGVYSDGEVLLSPNGEDYVAPRTFDGDTFWWGRIADPYAFMEIFDDGIEALLVDDDEE